MSGSALDPVLEIMLMLKNNWSLTGDLDNTNVKFSTDMYDDNLLLPQVIVRQDGGAYSYPMTVGNTGSYYTDTDIVFVNVWVRPKQDSNTSKGWAKNAYYQIRKEVERILRSVSSLGLDADGHRRYLWLSGWRSMPRVGDRPLLLHGYVEARIEKVRTGV